MTAADLAARCDKAHRGADGSWQACCPAHEDKTPSLSITDGDKGVILHCHAGCAPADVVAVLGLSMTDLFPPRTTRPPKGSPSKPRPRLVATYEYYDVQGTVLYQQFPEGLELQ